MQRLIALILFLSLLPLFVLIFVIILFFDSKPIFFTQRRIGLNRKSFNIYKFRTMTLVTNNQKHNKKSVGLENVTSLGGYLRTFSLDELPQILNIIKGDMNFVGPRPIIPAQLNAIPKRFYSRFIIRPGITGLAQINGRRNLDWMLQLEYDIYYVKRKTLLLDIFILLRTFGVVFHAKNTVPSKHTKNWRSYL